MEQETIDRFERRKADHIDLALKTANQAQGLSGLEQIKLHHIALPELNMEDVSLECEVLGKKRKTPFFVCGMTAGHRGGVKLNQVIAGVCEERQWIFGVGSQRRQLFDSSAANEWKEIREIAPTTTIIGNIGLSQLIEVEVSQVERLVESLRADALVVHTNPLQEVIQPEGTPFFKGGIRALENLISSLSVPVLFKETGCGISYDVARMLTGLGLQAVDVSGLGGTHWGRIEGERAHRDSIFHRAAQTYAEWGISTVDSVLNCVDSKCDFEIWASGGVRTGLDAVKLIALGASAVGFAKPVLEAAIDGKERLNALMAAIEYEARVGLFCTGCGTISDIRGRQPWKKI